MSKNYYKILDILPTASEEEIKKAFHKKALLYHPDRNAGFQKESEEKMKQVNEAWEILGNKDKRKQYNLDFSKVQEGYVYEHKSQNNSSKQSYKGGNSKKGKDFLHDDLVDIVGKGFMSLLLFVILIPTISILIYILISKSIFWEVINLLLIPILFLYVFTYVLARKRSFGEVFILLFIPIFIIFIYVVIYTININTS